MSTGSALDAKERVRQAVDIVDLVGDYLQLRREGRGFKALCPWHDDTRPSLQVNPERQSFKCWVCDIGGDVFSFVMKMENVSFPEALTMLAERAGVALDGRRAVNAEKQVFYQAMAWAEMQYHRCLLSAPEAEPARRYLAERGVSGDSIERFHVGFAPPGWDWLMRRAADSSYSANVLETIGLVLKRQSGDGRYDRFRNRVLFSIRDVQGRPVGLGGRILPGNDDPKAAKYINSPETPIYSKSHLLYGLDLARDRIARTHTALVMEGYTDVVAAHQAGLTEAVAVLGTALGPSHLQLLRRYADRVVLVLDGDEAGRRRTDQLVELFVGEPIDLRILVLPENLDPCDFLQQRGAAALRELADGAVDALEYKIRTATANLRGASGAHEVNQALEQVLATLAKTATAGDSAASLREDQILHRLALEFSVGHDALQRRLTALRRSARGRVRAAPEPAETTAWTRPELHSWERELLEALLLAPEAVDRVQRRIALDEMATPVSRRLLETCYNLAAQGMTPTFERLLLEFDEPELKTLLVSLDEEGRAKQNADALVWVEQVLDRFQRRSEDRQHREHTAALAQRRVDEEQQLVILQRIIEQQRSRQGISRPTDG